MVRKQLEGSAISAISVIILSANYAVIFPWDPCCKVAVNSKILGIAFHYRKLANSDLKITGRKKRHFQAKKRKSQLIHKFSFQECPVNVWHPSLPMLPPHTEASSCSSEKTLQNVWPQSYSLLPQAKSKATVAWHLWVRHFWEEYMWACVCVGSWTVERTVKNRNYWTLSWHLGLYTVILIGCGIMKHTKRVEESIRKR